MIFNPTVQSGKQETPVISVSSSGLITATAGDQSATQQLPTQAARTIRPGTNTQTAVASGRYTTGNVTVAGSTNLVPANIKSGVNIFGVMGTFEGSDLPNILALGKAETVGSGFTRHYQYEFSAPNGWAKCAFFCETIYGFIFNSDGTFFTGYNGSWNTSVSGDTITLSILPASFGGESVPSEAYVIFIK